jgi:hypothetical protein
MRRKTLLAGGADFGMGCVSLLQQRAEKTRVVRQFAAQEFDAEIDVAE